MGAGGAVTRIGKLWTKIAGLALGHGVRQNVMEAYSFLMKNYQRGDKIYLFGFSRGAYTARAIAGILRTVGLLRPDNDNLVPYAMKLYSQRTKKRMGDEARDKYWQDRDEFNRVFGNPDFPGRFDPQVHFLGVWDTVKFVGWLNIKGRLQQAKWPFTRNVSNVQNGRHAVAIDEKRNFYTDYRFVPGGTRNWDESQDLKELSFVGVHSDVGGTFAEHKLADITLQWMADEADAFDLRLDPGQYQRHVGVEQGTQLGEDYALGEIHTAGFAWFLIGLGWRPRKVVPHTGLKFHTAATSKPYRPKLADAEFTI